MSLGVPIKVLHEAEGHIVTCETKTGEVYRGKLLEAEDNMNCRLGSSTVTFRLLSADRHGPYVQLGYNFRDRGACGKRAYRRELPKWNGRVAAIDNVYIRGSKIRFLILPDMIKNAPMFKKPTSSKAGSSRPSVQKGIGRGRGMPLSARASFAYTKKHPY